MQNSRSLPTLCFRMHRFINDYFASLSGHAMPRRVVLPRGQVRSVMPGLRVAIEAGAVWMSLRGEPDDVTLSEGDSVRTGPGTVFEALTPSVLSISC